MSDTPQAKTRHDLDLAFVEAFRTTQAQIADLQANRSMDLTRLGALQDRISALEEGPEKHELTAEADSIAAAMTSLADVMPVPTPAEPEPQAQAA
jgi:hypothetical protein